MVWIVFPNPISSARMTELFLREEGGRGEGGRGERGRREGTGRGRGGDGGEGGEAGLQLPVHQHKSHSLDPGVC